MQIACCQFDIAWEDKPANFRRVTGLVRAAKLEPGALLLLPEMFATGFSMNTAVTAEPVNGPTARFLSDLAREHRIYVLGGVAIRPGVGRPQNQARVYDPAGQLVASYAKEYLFTLGGEDKHYDRGGGEIATFACGEGSPTVVPRVCYDLRFPERFRRALLAGAHLFAVIANWPVKRHTHWLTLLSARAIENLAFVAGCNRVGRDGNGLDHAGGSRIIDFGGAVLADAGGEETVITATVELAALREYRRALPFLEDMR